MSLPIAWIDKLFEKLSIRYGRDFLGRWEGMPIADIKTDWGDVLSGFRGHPDSIVWALENLPESKAPTATEFRALCRKAPAPNVPQIEAPIASRERMAKELEKLAPIVARKEVDGKDWARRLHARHESGEKLKPIQIRFYKEALGLKSENRSQHELTAAL